MVFGISNNCSLLVRYDLSSLLQLRHNACWIYFVMQDEMKLFYSLMRPILGISKLNGYISLRLDAFVIYKLAVFQGVAISLSSNEIAHRLE